MLARRKMSAGDLANAIGITPANLSILKNDKAKAVRFSTLEALCRVLDCQPGDIFTFDNEKED
jgi:putative transcriptional regulator